MASKGPTRGAPVSGPRTTAKFKPKPVALGATEQSAVVPEISASHVPPALAASPAVVEPVPATISPQPVTATETPVATTETPVATPVETAPVPVPELEDIAPEDPTPAAPAAHVMQEEVTMEATIDNATPNFGDQVQDKARTLFADANDRAKTALEKGSKMIEDLKEFSKGNVEALVESSKIAAKGVETLGQGAADYNRRQFESATAAMKTLASVKSPTEFFKLHSDYVRGAFDSMVAETSKNTETMLKLAGEIAQPISNRVAVAAEKIKIAA